jgi:tetratricopeptide (TPR) repeat protein
MLQRVLIVLLGAAFLFAPLPSFADTLLMKTGARREGVVEDHPADAGQIYFFTTGGRLSIRRDQIERIERSSPGLAWAGLGDQFMGLGRLDEAIDSYQKASAMAPGNTDIASRLEAALAEQRTQDAAGREKERQTALRLLDEALALADEKKFEDAVDKVRSAEQRAGFLIEKEARETMGIIHYKWGLSEIDRLNPRVAAEKLETALSFRPEAEGYRDTLISIYEKLPDKANLVIEHYRAKLEVEPSNDLLREKIAGLEYAQGNVRVAVDELLLLAESGRPMSIEARERLQAGLFSLVTDAANARDFDACVDLYRKLLTYFPDNDPGWLYYFEYYQQANAIDQQNPNEHITLARYCEEHELWDLAKAHFSTAIHLAPDNAEAQTGLQRIAEYDLVQLRQSMVAGDWLQAKFQATQIIQQYPRATEVIGEARETMDRADARLLEEARDNEKRAEEIARRGDDYYQQAQGYLQQLQSTEFNRNVRVYSPTQEAERYLNRAISAWREALKIDPSLADISKGDLRTKIEDAQRQLNSLQSGNRLSPRFRESYRVREEGN